jgi:hypothetical protein
MAAGYPLQVRLPYDELTELDDYRRKKPNPPSRAQALLELARKGGLQGSEHHALGHDPAVQTMGVTATT